ncbi:putative integral membrane protein [Pseudochelatococcus lubricantis]|uniref:Integral membrane protein n=1 Tax=Pseudochelatococcus lubricantis TaxID=1538102 RepID=A0ABX0V2J6_9HYPH|nr:putative integral membrane protein [Pseudochelatococcus lubricantis]
MKTLIRILIILPLTVVIVLLSVANRTPVQVSLDPFSGAAPLVAFSAPLFVIILTAVAVGVLLGGFAVWWSQGYYRRAARLRARELDRVKAEATARQAGSAQAAGGASSGGALALPTHANAR